MVRHDTYFLYLQCEMDIHYAVVNNSESKCPARNYVCEAILEVIKVLFTYSSLLFVLKAESFKAFEQL